MSKTEEYISRSENVILHTYNRFPVVLEKGEGVYLRRRKEIFGFRRRYRCFCSGLSLSGL